MQFAVVSPVRRETRNCSGLLHFLEFFDQIDHAVEIADALGHDQILAVDDISRDTLDLGHVVGGLPFGAQSFDGFVVFRLVEFVKLMPVASVRVFRNAASPDVQRSPFL